MFALGEVAPRREIEFERLWVSASERATRRRRLVVITRRLRTNPPELFVFARSLCEICANGANSNELLQPN